MEHKQIFYLRTSIHTYTAWQIRSIPSDGKDATLLRQTYQLWHHALLFQQAYTVCRGPNMTLKQHKQKNLIVKPGVTTSANETGWGFQVINTFLYPRYGLQDPSELLLWLPVVWKEDNDALSLFSTGIQINIYSKTFSILLLSLLRYSNTTAKLLICEKFHLNHIKIPIQLHFLSVLSPSLCSIIGPCFDKGSDLKHQLASSPKVCHQIFLYHIPLI